MFRLNAQIAPPTLVRIGHSGEPVAIIDDVFADADAIVDEVARLARFMPPPKGLNGYPGHRADAPPTYSQALLGAAQSALRAIFGSEGTTEGVACSFSLVTTPVETLHPLQTVPHVDVALPDRFAILHYLCAAQFGGTAFFRQNDTGFEQLDRIDWPTYAAARDESLSIHGAGGYPDEQTPGYTRTCIIPVRKNRMIVYRSISLHSGAILPDIPHPADPRSGRLTGNLFGRYRIYQDGC